MQAIMCADDVGTLDSTLIPVQVDGHATAYRSVSSVSLVELGKKLLECAKEGDTEQVRLLMSRGAPFTTDWLGISPLHYAAQNGHVETAEVLLRAGISRDARTKVERTPLHIAAQEGNTAVVELLLSSGAEVDSRDMLRMTPLHWAVEREHLETITVLLHHGADPNCMSKFNKTAFSIAMDNEREDIVQILQSTRRPEVEELAPAEALALQQATLAATHHLAMELAQAPAATHQEEVETSSTAAAAAAAATISAAAAAAAANDDVEVEDVPDPPPPPPPPERVFIKQERKSAGARKVIREISPGQQTLQFLQAHGITMLPADESTLVASAVESGQTVVLTEAGRLALGLASTPVPQKSAAPPPVIPLTTQTVSTMPLPRPLLAPAKKKVITIRASPLLVPNNKTANILKRPFATDRFLTTPSKVFVKTTPRTVTVTPPIRKQITSDVTSTVSSASASELAQQLEAARREVQAYKELLRSKEREAEQYKLQLQSMTRGK